ncbi:MAG: leucine-rich repeat protein [Kiritimatiellaeota bacterium]|nr:leucine-rich repeat protein [Kiritimatiellota bacterium]
MIDNQLTFNAQGGLWMEGAAPSPVLFTNSLFAALTGVNVLCPALPEVKKLGYHFKGWNTSPDGNGTTLTPGLPISLDHDAMLYAQYSTDENHIVPAHWIVISPDRMVHYDTHENPTGWELRISIDKENRVTILGDNNIGDVVNFYPDGEGFLDLPLGDPIYSMYDIARFGEEEGYNISRQLFVMFMNDTYSMEDCVNYPEFMRADFNGDGVVDLDDLMPMDAWYNLHFALDDFMCEYPLYDHNPYSPIILVAIADTVGNYNNSPFYPVAGRITTMTLPDTLEYIGDMAFLVFGNFNDPNFTTLPDSVTHIGKQAFYIWEFFDQPFTMPDSVESIGVSSFEGWVNMNSPFVLSAGLKNIPGGAFVKWGLYNQSFAIPAAVTNIGHNAFYGWYDFDQFFIIPENVESMGNGVFANCFSLPGVIFEGPCPEFVTIGEISGIYYSYNGFPKDFATWVHRAHVDSWENEFPGILAGSAILDNNPLRVIEQEITYEVGSAVYATALYTNSVLANLISGNKVTPIINPAPPPPSIPDMYFAGWVDASGADFDNVTVVGTSDFTVYAVFDDLPEFMSELRFNNGELATGGQENNLYAFYGLPMPALDMSEPPVWDDMHFMGYWDSAEDEGTMYYGPDMMPAVTEWDKEYNGVVLLYARWGEHPVYLHQAPGTGGATVVFATSGSVLPIATAPKHPQSNMFFMGYFTENMGNGVQYYNWNMRGQQKWVIGGPEILYAHYEQSNAQVSFKDSDYGIMDNPPAPQYFMPGQAYGTLRNVRGKINGVTAYFAGWYTEPECINKVTGKTVTDPNAQSHILYAKFTDTQNTSRLLYYRPNGGTIDGDPAISLLLEFDNSLTAGLIIMDSEYYREPDYDPKHDFIGWRQYDSVGLRLQSAWMEYDTVMPLNNRIYVAQWSIYWADTPYTANPAVTNDLGLTWRDNTILITSTNPKYDLGGAVKKGNVKLKYEIELGDGEAPDGLFVDPDTGRLFGTVANTAPNGKYVFGVTVRGYEGNNGTELERVPPITKWFTIEVVNYEEIEPMVTVSYDPNDGTAPDYFWQEEVPTSGSYSHYNPPAAPLYDGWAFQGWFLGSKRITVATPLALNINHTVTAFWAKVNDPIYSGDNDDGIITILPPPGTPGVTNDAPVEIIVDDGTGSPVVIPGHLDPGDAPGTWVVVPEGNLPAGEDLDITVVINPREQDEITLDFPDVDIWTDSEFDDGNDGNGWIAYTRILNQRFGKYTPASNDSEPLGDKTVTITIFDPAGNGGDGRFYVYPGHLDAEGNIILDGPVADELIGKGNLDITINVGGDTVAGAVTVLEGPDVAWNAPITDDDAILGSLDPKDMDGDSRIHDGAVVEIILGDGRRVRGTLAEKGGGYGYDIVLDDGEMLEGGDTIVGIIVDPDGSYPLEIPTVSPPTVTGNGGEQWIMVREITAPPQTLTGTDFVMAWDTEQITLRGTVKYIIYTSEDLTVPVGGWMTYDTSAPATPAVFDAVSAAWHEVTMTGFGTDTARFFKVKAVKAGTL